jgi:hypothetical protein
VLFSFVQYIGFLYYKYVVTFCWIFGSIFLEFIDWIKYQHYRYFFDDHIRYFLNTATPYLYFPMLRCRQKSFKFLKNKQRRRTRGTAVRTFVIGLTSLQDPMDTWQLMWHLDQVSCYISTQVHVIYTVYNLYLYILSCEFLIQGLAGLFIFNSYDINFV